MHSRRHQWTTFTLIATVALAMGCRGARPLSLVKISKADDTGLPEVEAPRQRLAVNKPNPQGDAVVSKPPVQDGNPHVNRTSEAQANASPSRPANDTVTMSLADTGTTTTRPPTANRPPTNQTNQTNQTTATNVSLTNASAADTPAQTAKQNNAVASKESRVEEMSEAEMTAAFESQPEYVKRMAMQQLIASIKASAEKTSQPAEVDSAIAKSIDHLPELPPSTGAKPAIPAKRIAAQDQVSSAPKTAAGGDTASTASAPSNSPASQVAKATASDDQDSTLESVVVQSISDQGDESEVQPVSASRGPDDGSMIAQASLEPSTVSPAATNQLTEQALYSELLRRLSTAPAGESEADRSSRLIKQRHLMVLSGNPDAAVEKIAEMTESEQEYMRHHLLGLWTMVDPEGHPVPSRRFTTALPQMREATKFAAAATDSLDVRSLAFCTGIESYGQIKTFPGNRFQGGQKVILYCEIENFTVAKTSEGFETHLQGSYDIYNADNEKVVSQLLPADKQVSANYLRDYFIAYQMHLPQQLAAGTYRLQLTMEDVGGKKYGQSSIPFEIAK